MSVGPPAVHDLAADLARIRRAGIVKLRTTQAPFLRQTAIELRGTDEPSALEDLLRIAINGLGSAQRVHAALLMLGMAQGTRGMSPVELRRMAADQYDVLPETFRKRHERQILTDLAEQLRGLLVQHQHGPPPVLSDDETSEQRLDRLAREIGQLTAAELGQFLPLLYAQLGVSQEGSWRSRQ